MTFSFIPANNGRPQIRKSREFDSRPCLTVNRLPQFVRQVTNDQRQNRPSIKIRPADDNADPETAGFFKVLCVISKTTATRIRLTTTPFLCSDWFIRLFPHRYGLRIGQQFRAGNLYPSHCKPALCLGDADSNEPDGGDWNYCFVVEEVPRDAFGG